MVGAVDSDYVAILSSIPIELAKWNLGWQSSQILHPAFGICMQRKGLFAQAISLLSMNGIT